MNKIKTLFFGSGDFAVPILEGLIDNEFVELVGVVTQPDKPAGRDKEDRSVPVKELIKKINWSGKLFTPKLYRIEQEEILNSTKPEIIIVADYGQLLPEFTINYPKYKCLNVHGSLLPDLRGAVPIPIAILNGYKVTGVSIPVMTVGLDDGPVVASRECEISDEDDTSSLKLKLANIGASLLLEMLPSWVKGEINAEVQDESKATFAGKELISKDKARFDSTFELLQVDRMVRAFYPWPIAWCELNFNGKVVRLKIYEAKVSKEFHNEEIGEMVREGKSLFLRLEGGALELQKIQLEGKKIGSSEDYLYLAGSHIKQ